MNRPDRRNALDVPLRIALGDVIEAALADPKVRAIVLTGAAHTFCSGGDVSAMGRAAEPEARARVQTVQRITKALVGCDIPVIAAVEGAAVGAGLSLALACDRVVAATDAKFAGSFTGVGLAADAGILWSLPRRVGPAAARQILMFGQRLNSVEALDIGLIDVVVDPQAVFDTALADAYRIAAGPPLALASLKRSFAYPAGDLESALNAEVDIQVKLIDSDDYVEGIAAFKEKRKPVFTGK
ncbi:enoyl-CoA hydratase [Mycobacterium colombiense]|nr:enoyl-CoA hydratase [Mycobacterium colombiense]